MKGRAIVLDFDNTIIEYKRTCVELHAKAAETLGLRVPAEEEIAAYAGMPWDQMIDRIWPGIDSQSFKGAYRAIPNRKSQVPGALEAIEKLAQDNVLCILSSKSKEDILRQLEEAGIPSGHFRLISSAEGAVPSKPDPRAFSEILGMIGREKRADAIYVGDSNIDAFAAMAAGIRFVGVLSGWASSRDFEAIGICETVNSIAELPEYLSSLPELSTIEEAAEELKAGRFVIVLDDAKRENEGDLTLAAQCATPEKIAFMLRNTSGVLCTPASNGILDRLSLPPLAGTNTDKFQTPFTVSVDSKKCAGSGVSAEDRCTTARALADPSSRPEDFGRPGHVFPLRPNKNGVLGRRGHTEAAADLMRIAGLAEAAVIGELMGTDGRMMRGRKLSDFARDNGIKAVSIGQIAEYRLRNEKLAVREASSSLKTAHGDFELVAYSSSIDGMQALALVKGKPENGAAVRVHSECFTGETLLSKRCDCREQLSSAMSLIERIGSGVVVYLRQEGRGIGLVNKIRAYHLQDSGLDTVEANISLGFKPDTRDYWMAAHVLRDLGISSIRLLTNNFAKAHGLEALGISVDAVVPLPADPNGVDNGYLKTKKFKLGHVL